MVLALLCLGGCAGLPRDPDGTSERIARDGVIRVGIVRETGGITGTEAPTRRFLEKLSASTGARAQVRAGATEPLMHDLEEGQIDLVLAPLAKQTAWKAKVDLGPKLAEATIGRTRLEWRPASPPGENRFIASVHAAALDAGGTR